MTVKTASGSTLAIGDTSVASTQTQYEAVTFTGIGEIESLGTIGDAANPVTFASIGDGRVRKSKGARDAGTMEVVCGHDPNDTGQAALDAAEATNYEYNFKLTFADARNENYTNTVWYFRALVITANADIGTNDNIVRKRYQIGVNSAIVKVPSVQFTSPV